MDKRPDVRWSRHFRELIRDRMELATATTMPTTRKRLRVATPKALSEAVTLQGGDAGVVRDASRAAAFTGEDRKDKSFQ